MTKLPILCIMEKLEQTLPPYGKHISLCVVNRSTSISLFHILLIYLSTKIKNKLVKFKFEYLLKILIQIISESILILIVV